MALAVVLAQLPGTAQERPVLVEVTQVASHVLAVAVDRLGVAAALAFESDDLAVGQELREGAVQQMVRLLFGVVAYEVHRHVVGGTERRDEVVGAALRERRHALEVDLLLIEHDGVADLVDATPPRPPGELRVLAGREQLVPLTLELPQVLDHHGLGRHVDAERERLGREHHLHETGFEQLLDGLLEDRQHARMVGRHPGREPVEEVVEAERDEVLLVDPGGSRLRALADVVGLGATRERDARLADPPHAPVAARPAEHEVDRRHHAVLLEHVDHLGPSRHVHAPMPFPRSRDALLLRVPAAAPVVRLRAQLVLVERDDVGVRDGHAVLLDVHRDAGDARPGSGAPAAPDGVPR